LLPSICVDTIPREVFAVDDTALGGWLANGARFTTVAIAILLTIFKDRFWKAVSVADESLQDEKKRSIEKQRDFAVGMRSVVARVVAGCLTPRERFCLNE
jgi:hypothetical protein